MNATKLIYLLLLSLLFFHCKEEEKNKPVHKTSSSSSVTAIEVLLNDAKNKAIDSETRIKKLDNAILKAKLQRNDSLLFKAYLAQVNLFVELKRFDSADSLNRKIINWTDSNQHAQYKGNAYFSFANYFSEHNQLDSAFHYYTKAKHEFLKTKDYEGAAKSNINIAAIFNDTGSYLISENVSLEAINYIKDKPNHLYLIPAYNNLAVSSGNMSNYTEELYWYDKALALTDDANFIKSLNNNKAVALTFLKRYEEAIEILKNLLSDPSIKDFPELEGRVIDNLAYAKFMQNPKRNSDRDFTRALSILESVEDYTGISVVLDHLTEYYKIKDPKKAVDYANYKYKISYLTKNAESRLKALKTIIQLSPSKQKITEYVKLSDSLQLATNDAKYQFAKLRFDADANRAQIQHLLLTQTQNELNIERTKRWIIIGSALILIGAIGGVSYIYFLNQKRENERQKTIYQTEVQISEKLHDELANDLFATITLVESIQFPDPQLKEKLTHNLDHIYSQTRNISRENSRVNTENFLEEIHLMLANYQSKEISVINKGLDTIPWHKIANKYKIVIYRVLMELMTNMKKHSNCNVVVVKFKMENKILKVDYIDNGTVNPALKINNKNGLMNIESRLKGVSGKINFDLTNGYKAFIQIPIS